MTCFTFEGLSRSCSNARSSAGWILVWALPEEIGRGLGRFLGESDLLPVHAVGLVEHDDERQVLPFLFHPELHRENPLDQGVGVALLAVARLAGGEDQAPVLVAHVGLESEHCLPV